jgi:hypothetical protein
MQHGVDDPETLSAPAKVLDGNKIDEYGVWCLGGRASLFAFTVK